MKAPASQSPAPSQNEAELHYKVQRLSQEIEQLRTQQALQQQLAMQPAPPLPKTPPELRGNPSIIVFRDGHRLSIRNYMISGQMLWVLDNGTSTRISSADLDLDATQKENGGRSLRFSDK